ncbi:MAG: hypothetical protein LQ351_005565 [Letrouitia transgressa]|nr:MAG: hypothetical protein LQ351_005565 [Letrouitia transgressa]
MPSALRNSVAPETFTTATFHPKTTSPPEKRQKMSLTQTYYLAHTARGKLSKEAARADHDLRLLVGHANLLDSLMLDLADAEREQESWFNQTVKGAAKASDEPKHIQWADTIQEEIEDEEYDDDSSDSDSDSEDDEIDYAQSVHFRRLVQKASAVTTSESAIEDSDEEMEDDEEFDRNLALTRTPSHSSSEYPPELMHESSDSESDEDMPPSPPSQELTLEAFSEKQRQAIATTGFYQTRSEKDAGITSSLPAEDQASFFDEGFYIPPRQQAPTISAF